MAAHTLDQRFPVVDEKHGPGHAGHPPLPKVDQKGIRAVNPLSTVLGAKSGRPGPGRVNIRINIVFLSNLQNLLDWVGQPQTGPAIHKTKEKRNKTIRNIFLDLFSDILDSQSELFGLFVVMTEDFTLFVNPI